MTVIEGQILKNNMCVCLCIFYKKKSVTLYRSYSDKRLDGRFRYFCEEKYLKHNLSVQLFRGLLSACIARIFRVLAARFY
jgi:hypothetical protein